MQKNTVKILGVKITTEDEGLILEKIDKYLKKGKIRKVKDENNRVKPYVIFTPNPEIIVLAQKEASFKKAVNKAQINIPDGSGVIWAIGKKFGRKVRRISGADMLISLCRMAVKKSYRIGLIGGRSGLALAASKCLESQFPGIKIMLLGEPEIRIIKSNFNIHDANGKHIETGKYINYLAKELSDKKLDIVFVALGFPKQEFFITELAACINRLKGNQPVVLMAVGGSLDYLAGNVSRAPRWLRMRGLEWSYRLIKEPWRLKRHILGSVFFPQVYFSNLKTGKICI